MGQKIKPRQQRKPRSIMTRDMILNTKGGFHSDKREKRSKNPNKGSWERDWEE
jgi:hypothetical protein